jgi:ribosomal protein S19
MLGLRFFVYNGIRFFSLEVTTEKLGHRLGEFSPTKKKPIAKKKKK